MKTPEVIYLQICDGCYEDNRTVCENCNFDNQEATWCKDRINDSDAVYFSEEAVRNLLRDEYRQANNIVNMVSKHGVSVKGGGNLINVEKSVEDAIKKLKGGRK